MVRTYEGNKVFSDKKIGPALDLIKCLKQIKYQRLLLTCAPISELPSNMSTMRQGMEFCPDCIQGINLCNFTENSLCMQYCTIANCGPPIGRVAPR